MLQWCLLLLLLFLAPAVHVQAAEQLELPSRCNFLKDQKEKLRQMCRSDFPMVTHMRYRDTFMKYNDKMALFMPSSLDYVMISLKESELHRCESIQLLQLKEYVCYDSDGGKRTIKLNKVYMHCFPFQLQIAEDLISECIHNGDFVDSTLDEQVMKTKSVIIHYVFDHDSTGRLRCHHRVVLLLLLVGFPLQRL
ncbi:hypothetical protein KR222_003853 [Zaprionus bogoriensis]|nr:hypothetical protein KR222_003853 [Zaprionus bogoriensis]